MRSRASRAARSMAPTASAVPIIRHPDVRRMLMTMRAQIEAMRALVAFVAGSIDRAKRHAGRSRADAPPGDGRSADAGREGLVHGHRLRRGVHGSPGSWRPRLHRVDRAQPSISATPASRRSTKARTASRPSTSSAASWRAMTGRPCATLIDAMNATFEAIKSADGPPSPRNWAKQSSSSPSRPTRSSAP